MDPLDDVLFRLSDPYCNLDVHDIRHALRVVVLHLRDRPSGVQPITSCPIGVPVQVFSALRGWQVETFTCAEDLESDAMHYTHWAPCPPSPL